MDSTSVSNRELREPTGSPWPHYTLMTLHLVLLLGPEFRHRQTVAYIGTVVLMMWCWFAPNFTTNLGQAQLFSLAWSTYLATLEKIVLPPQGSSPENSFYRMDQAPGQVPPYTPFSPRKLQWATALIFNMRGIRWNYQVKNVPSLPARIVRSRFDFVATRLVAAAYYLAMVDLVSHAAVNIFYTNEETLQRGEVDSRFLTIWDDRSLIWSFVRALTFALQPYYGIQLQYTVCSAIAVTLGISQPADWPPSFGRLSDTVSIRKFWGTYWHQTLRRMFSAWTLALRDACGIEKGTLLSRYSQLWLSFAISGCGHAASILILPSPKNVTTGQRTIGLIIFFVWQAAVITLEDGISFTWHRIFKGVGAQQSLIVRIICYAWVVGHLWFSIGWAGDVFLHMRLSEEPLFPFTVTGKLISKVVPSVRQYLVAM